MRGLPAWVRFEGPRFTRQVPGTATTFIQIQSISINGDQTNKWKSLNIFPVPSTTDASGSSAIDTGRPVSCRCVVQILEQRAAAGKHDAPVADIGGEFRRVRSRATRMAFMMVATHSESVRGFRSSSHRDGARILLDQISTLDLHGRTADRAGYAEPTSILTLLGGGFTDQ